MLRLLSLLLASACLAASPALAQVRTVPPEVLATIIDDEPIIPRSMTAEERQRWVLPDASERGVEPVGALFTPPEYTPNEALMLRWGYFNSVITEISVATTTETDEAEIILIVADQGQADSAASVLDNAGADLARIDFQIMPSDTVWIRDYGPRSLFVDNERALMDHSYNRPRPNDDQVPSNLASETGEALYELPLVHGGGNFHLFGNGEAFMTDLITAENPGWSEADVEALYADYHDLDLTLLDPLPASFDSTQHLDMWFLPVDDDTVIIGEYDPMEAGGTPHQITEAASTLLTERGYTVLRTPGWGADAHYTYTNSVIINEAVLVCQFNDYPTENAQAVEVFEQAFPDRVIVGIDCSTIINSAGAIHCIVMHYSLRGNPLLKDRFEPGSF